MNRAKLSAQLSRRLRTQPLRINLEMDCPRAIRISRAARKCWLWERDCINIRTRTYACASVVDGLLNYLYLESTKSSIDHEVLTAVAYVVFLMIMSLGKTMALINRNITHNKSHNKSHIINRK